mmetsp:Transcript_21868/g.37691  ORF Transcript_21868/g.37691 Transcript_21868/m.37691 type:complete len:176 (+) Transcript_21868:219-746(+)
MVKRGVRRFCLIGALVTILSILIVVVYTVIRGMRDQEWRRYVLDVLRFPEPLRNHYLLHAASFFLIQALIFLIFIIVFQRKWAIYMGSLILAFLLAGASEVLQANNEQQPFSITVMNRVIGVDDMIADATGIILAFVMCAMVYQRRLRQIEQKRRYYDPLGLAPDYIQDYDDEED